MVQEVLAAASLLIGANESLHVSSSSLDGSAGHVTIGEFSAHQRQSECFEVFSVFCHYNN